MPLPVHSALCTPLPCPRPIVLRLPAGSLVLLLLILSGSVYRNMTIFPQVLQDSSAHHNGKGQQVGDRAFRCGYKGCGRLYTTAHHLKVSAYGQLSARSSSLESCNSNLALPWSHPHVTCWKEESIHRMSAEEAGTQIGREGREPKIRAHPPSH